jgi:hypothetical protein
VSQIYAKSWKPGEENKSTYRIEIGHDDGHEPHPYETIAMVIKVTQDLLKECEIAKNDDEASEILKRMIDTTQLKVEKRVSQ